MKSMKKAVIIPSIIAKNQSELTTRIAKVKNHCSIYQIDVMDGKFLKNSSFQFDFKLPKSKHKVEAHLMVNDPLEWTKQHYKQVNTIIAHIESFKTPKQIKAFITFVHKKRKKAGLAIKPRTPLKKMSPYIKHLDMITIMTVHPGKYGSTFLPSTLKKVSSLRKKFPKLTIEVDGGITDKTVNQAAQAGANQFISGSYLQKAKDIKVAMSNLQKEVQRGI